MYSNLGVANLLLYVHILWVQTVLTTVGSTLGSVLVEVSVVVMVSVVVVSQVLPGCVYCALAST